MAGLAAGAKLQRCGDNQRSAMMVRWLLDHPDDAQRWGELPPEKLREEMERDDSAVRNAEANRESAFTRRDILGLLSGNTKGK